MDPTITMRRRVDEFKDELPSTDEIQSFYGLEECSVQTELRTVKERTELRPYTWSNTVTSLDGVVNNGNGASGVTLVGLKNIPNAKARTDFHLLQAGWAYADAILFSAASLRSERNQKLLIRSKSIIAFRTETLGKKTEQPDVVIVTTSGWIDISLPIWSAGAATRRKLITTSTSGMENLLASVESQFERLSSSINGDSASSTLSVQEWLEKHKTTIKSFSKINEPCYSTLESPLLSFPANDIDLSAMSRFLKSDWQIDHMDVSAGPTLISLMVKAKLMDEYRYTSSGIVLGRCKEDYPTTLRTKTETFPSEINQYKQGESPLLEIMAVRLHGPFHVYHRGKWIYNH